MKSPRKEKIQKVMLQKREKTREMKKVKEYERGRKRRKRGDFEKQRGETVFSLSDQLPFRLHNGVLSLLFLPSFHTNETMLSERGKRSVTVRRSRQRRTTVHLSLDTRISC